MDCSFKGYKIPDYLWKEIISLSERKMFHKNEIIQMQGEPVTTIFFFLSGKARISNLFPNGEERMIYICYAPFVYGEISYLLHSGHYTTSLIAMSECEIAMVSGETLWSHFEQNQDFNVFLLYLTATKADSYHCQAIATGVGLTFEQKTANILLNVNKFILSLDGKYRNADISQCDLARLMFTARSSISRQVQKFVSLGLVETSRGHIKIRDREGLARLAMLSDRNENAGSQNAPQKAEAANTF